MPKYPIAPIIRLYLEVHKKMSSISSDVSAHKFCLMIKWLKYSRQYFNVSLLRICWAGDSRSVRVNYLSSEKHKMFSCRQCCLRVYMDSTRERKRNQNILCSISQAQQGKVFNRLDRSLKMLGVSRPLISDGGKYFGETL